VLDVDNDKYLRYDEFVKGMTNIFTESYENLVNYIFRLYDFNRDDLISKEDVRIVMSYVPLKTNIENGRQSEFGKY
jgi:Ca2+-binding EF-hand superfamily protein